MPTISIKPNAVKGILILLTVFCFMAKGQIHFNKRIKTYNAAGGGFSIIPHGTDYIISGFKFLNYGSSSNLRYLFIKTDANGDTLLTKSYGKKKYDYYSGESGGACLLNHKLYDFGTKTDTLNHVLYILYKLDSNGDTLFQKTWGDTSNIHSGSQIKINK